MSVRNKVVVFADFSDKGKGILRIGIPSGATIDILNTYHNRKAWRLWKKLTTKTTRRTSVWKIQQLTRRRLTR